MNARESVMCILNGQKPNRMLCFGVNSTLTYDQIEKVQAFWPEGHGNEEIMAKQAMAIHPMLGFDTVRVQFSQTFEAEALGCKIKPGRVVVGSERILGIDHPPPYTLDGPIEFLDDFLSWAKIPGLLKTVRILKDALDGEVSVQMQKTMLLEAVLQDNKIARVSRALKGKHIRPIVKKVSRLQ